MDFETRVASALEHLRPCAPLSALGRQSDLGAEPRSLAARMAELKVPGVGVALAGDFETAWIGGFGLRSTRTGAPVSTQTRFQAGSISKPVFALAVMRLVEQGRVDLDEDVGAYLRSWRIPSSRGWRPRVTLRRLLSHTAGATVHGFPGYRADGPIPTPVEVLDGSPGVNTPPVLIDVVPGTLQRYSGGGTTIAQQAIVDLTGMPFPELMRELVLGPVGMVGSSYEQPPAPALAEHAASGHTAGGAEVPGGWHVYPEMAAAGLWTTPGDLAALAVEICKILDGRPSRLELAQGSLRAMLRPQLPDQAEGDEYIRIGWYCRGAGDDFVMGHAGGDEGFIANLEIHPKRGVASVVMTNGQRGFEVCLEVGAALRREFGWPGEPGSYDPDAGAPGRAAGEFEGPAGQRAELRVAADALWLKLADQEPIRLSPYSDGEWFAEPLNLRLRLSETSDGKWRSLALQQPGKTIRFKRTP